MHCKNSVTRVCTRAYVIQYVIELAGQYHNSILAKLSIARNSIYLKAFTGLPLIDTYALIMLPTLSCQQLNAHCLRTYYTN